MLTAEKAHLLLTRDSGRPEAPSLHATALAAASLADLRRAGVVRIEEAPARTARVWVVGAGTTGDPVLDALLPGLDRASGKTAASLVAKGRPAALKPVVAHLTETGHLEDRRISFLETRHVPVSDTVRRDLVERLTAVALGDAEGSEEDLLLLGVLKHLNVARRLLPGTHEREDRRELSRRLDSLTREDVLVQAVRRAVDGQAGAIAATAAAGAVVVG